MGLFEGYGRCGHRGLAAHTHTHIPSHTHIRSMHVASQNMKVRVLGEISGKEVQRSPPIFVRPSRSIDRSLHDSCSSERLGRPGRKLGHWLLATRRVLEPAAGQRPVLTGAVAAGGWGRPGRGVLRRVHVGLPVGHLAPSQRAASLGGGAPGWCARRARLRDYRQ